MSALGGMIAHNSKVIQQNRLVRMSCSMLLRGKDWREAYWNGTVGMIHNGNQIESHTAFRQPFILTRGAKTYLLAWDGIINEPNGKAEPFRMSTESQADRLLDAYLSFGTEWVSSLTGAFSLALYDEFHNELLLVRDRIGNRPLFYIQQDGGFCFASEIKALFSATDEPFRVERSRLCAHLTAPYGTYIGSDLYRDVCSIPPGHCGLYSPLGLNVFAYEPSAEAESETAVGITLSESPEFYPNSDDLRRCLVEALFAFDYPQFDCFMPEFLHLLESVSEPTESAVISVPDSARCLNLTYATERADRLGSIKQRWIRSVPSSRPLSREREWKRMERMLRQLLESSDVSLLSFVFGNDWQMRILQEKNTARRIRVQGLLYQTILWLTHYPIRLV